MASSFLLFWVPKWKVATSLLSECFCYLSLVNETVSCTQNPVPFTEGVHLFYFEQLNTWTYLLASLGKDGLSNGTVVIEEHLVEDPEHGRLRAQPCAKIAGVCCVHQLLHQAVRAQRLGIDVFIVGAHNVAVHAYHTLAVNASQGAIAVAVHQHRVFAVKVNTTWNTSGISTILTNW